MSNPSGKMQVISRSAVTETVVDTNKDGIESEKYADEDDRPLFGSVSVFSPSQSTSSPETACDEKPRNGEKNATNGR